MMIRSKPSTKEFREHYDQIFRKHKGVMGRPEYKAAQERLNLAASKNITQIPCHVDVKCRGKKVF